MAMACELLNGVLIPVGSVHVGFVAFCLLLLSVTHMKFGVQKNKKKKLHIRTLITSHAPNPRETNKK